MNLDFNIGPYDPCPCGSGKKYKFCCAARAKANRHGKFPVGTVAYYGPDDQTVTKIAAGVILSEKHEPMIERFVGTDVADDPKVGEQIRQFFAKNGVKSVVFSQEIMGCPHEEVKDFPAGQDCPFCPFWAGKQGSGARDDPAVDDEKDTEADEFADEDKDESDAGSVSPEEADEAFDRISQILDDDTIDMGQATGKLCAHLQKVLDLPCEVTGSEDFQWEEGYVLGMMEEWEHRKLRKTKPSYMDKFELIRIEADISSEWMILPGEDIAAHVRRISDGKKFTLGLSDIEATDKASKNYRLIRDFGIWLANSR